ncbi:MAG: glutamine amidotransferase [Tropicimonas sp.]|uniref:glutamine amidotransferase n=1 Tax=Tropicimonas sp. TaxID=2067044 RepID=UPI003A850FCA
MTEQTKPPRILIVGETVFKIHTHYKGFAAYETGYITSSLDAFTGRFTDEPVEIDFMPNHEVSQKFPFTLEELSAWDVIVFSDAPADSFLLAPETLAGELRPNRLRVLGDWVRAGGGFAMIGGWMSFGGFHGKGHWAYSPITELIPATIQPHDDRMETPEGALPRALAAHPLTDGLPREWPDFLGYNRLCDPTGEVLLAFDNGDPLLVVDSRGKGRVAAFTSDLLPHWGSPRFVAWEGYVPFWTGLFQWLAGRPVNRR